MITEPKTLQDAIIHFSDFENCKAFMMELRWPDGVVKCPHCGSDARHLACQGPRLEVLREASTVHSSRLKTGTIFEDSPLGLDKWLTALWLVVNCKNGISSYEVAPRPRDHPEVRLVHGSPHPVCARIRDRSRTCSPAKSKRTKPSSAARRATCTPTNARRKITGTGGKDKTAVMGILERGRARSALRVVPNRKKKALQAEVRKHVEAGSALYTDALQSYEALDEFQHQVVDHAVEYVDGKIHTNGLENFWSLLKRGINGTYVRVEPFHLFRYLDEQAFRYNNRKDDDGEPLDGLRPLQAGDVADRRQAPHLESTHRQTGRARNVR